MGTGKIIKKNRFDNKLLCFQTHVIELFSLRHLSDKLCSHLRAMSTIATKEQNADGLLTYLSTTKMDKTSQIKNELPAWDSLKEFFFGAHMPNVGEILSSQCRATKKASFKNRHVHVAATIPCPMYTFCDSADHFITSFNLFSNLAPSIR